MDGEVKAELERIRDENAWQNKRLDKLEKKMETVEEMNITLHEMSINTKVIAEEIKKQGAALETQGKEILEIKSAPGQSWNNMKRTVFNTLLGAACGGIVMVIGMLIVFSFKNLM